MVNLSTDSFMFVDVSVGITDLVRVLRAETPGMNSSIQICVSNFSQHSYRIPKQLFLMHNSMYLPVIHCRQENHYSMPYEYVCTRPLCLKNAQHISCLYCCQQSHQDHINYIQTLKTLLAQIDRQRNQCGEFEVIGLLLKGLKQCETQSQLRQNISELLFYVRGGSKCENLVDHDHSGQQKHARKFYQNRTSRKLKSSNHGEQTVAKNKEKSPLCLGTGFISPVFTFAQEDALMQGYSFVSPFCVSSQQNKIVTAFAYPALNRFNDSVEVIITIQRLTPFWLGVGVSKGKATYEDKSKKHIILTSNGWLCAEGETKKTPVKYCMKDRVLIKWDKNKQLIEFSSNGQRQTVQVDLLWDQDVYLCAVLYYKGDCVQL